MKVAILFAAMAVGCLVYWLARLLPWAPEPLQPIRRRWLPRPNVLLRRLSEAVRRTWRQRAVQRAVGSVLSAMARLCEVDHDPVHALAGAIPLTLPPLQGELAEALRRTQGGWPLSDALRLLASRNGSNTYLLALAELVAGHEREGGNLAAGLRRLLEHLEAAEPRRVAALRWRVLGRGAGVAGLVLAAGLLLARPVHWRPVPPSGELAVAATILLGAAAAGLGTYAWVLTLRPFSPRQLMVRRLGAPTAPAANAAPAPWHLLRRLQLDRAYPALLAFVTARVRAGADPVAALCAAPPALPQPLRAEVEAFARAVEAGAPLAAALEALSARCGSRAVATLVRRILYEQSVGIPLAATLEAEAGRVLSGKPLPL